MMLLIKFNLLIPRAWVVVDRKYKWADFRKRIALCPMDCIESPLTDQKQQEKPPLTRGQGTMDATHTPEPPQLHQQEQPQLQRCQGTMDVTPTPQLPHPHQQEQQQPTESLQQEQPNSYMLPANIIFNQSQQPKKRGRPRKSHVDGLGLSPTPISEGVSAAPLKKNSMKAHGGAPGSKNKQQPQNLDFGCASGVTGAAAFKNPSKNPLGRQPCSKKKQEALGGVGFGWTPHLMHVHIGEDIATKVLTLSQEGPRPLTVSIISASGVVCDVTLRKSAIIDDDSMTYEGQFFIISLSGSLLLSESNGSPSITGGLSLSMSGPDHKVLCGVVSGELKAASPVQLVVGSFIPKKEKPMSEAPSLAPPFNVLNFSATVTEATTPSQGSSSHFADENDGNVAQTNVKKLP